MSVVIKRDGSTEAIKFDKVTARIAALTTGLDKTIDSVRACIHAAEQGNIHIVSLNQYFCPHIAQRPSLPFPRS